MFALFDVAYRQANHPYLEKSFGVLHYAAIATHGDDSAGFALGELRILDLPRLPQQAVAMAGICCIAPALPPARAVWCARAHGDGRRRHHAFGADDQHRTDGASRELPDDGAEQGRRAEGGASRRRRGSRRWARRSRRRTARRSSIPTTFVCHGSGVPIGYPAMDLDVQPEEWEAFKPVDRDKGDSLLGLSWMPDPPEGWG